MDKVRGTDHINDLHFLFNGHRQRQNRCGTMGYGLRTE